MFGVVFFVSKTPLGIERQKELKALVKRSLKLSQVENLGLLATPFGQVLRALALTRDDLRSLWSRSNLHTSQSKFITVWPPNPSQRKLSDVHQPIISP